MDGFTLSLQAGAESYLKRTIILCLYSNVYINACITLAQLLYKLLMPQVLVILTGEVAWKIGVCMLNHMYHAPES